MARTPDHGLTFSQAQKTLLEVAAFDEPEGLIHQKYKRLVQNIGESLTVVIGEALRVAGNRAVWPYDALLPPPPGIDPTQIEKEWAEKSYRPITYEWAGKAKNTNDDYLGRIMLWGTVGMSLYLRDGKPLNTQDIQDVGVAWHNSWRDEKSLATRGSVVFSSPYRKTGHIPVEGLEFSPPYIITEPAERGPYDFDEMDFSDLTIKGIPLLYPFPWYKPEPYKSGSFNLPDHIPYAAQLCLDAYASLRQP